MQSFKFLENIKFLKMHVFKYSPRKGTKAAIMENQISNDVKEKRSKQLIELSEKNESAILEEYMGKEVEVLFEQEEKGHTTNYILVQSSSDIEENTIRGARVIGVNKDCLIADVIDA